MLLYIQRKRLFSDCQIVPIAPLASDTSWERAVYLFTDARNDDPNAVVLCAKFNHPKQFNAAHKVTIMRYIPIQSYLSALLCSQTYFRYSVTLSSQTTLWRVSGSHNNVLDVRFEDVIRRIHLDMHCRLQTTAFGVHNTCTFALDDKHVYDYRECILSCGSHIPFFTAKLMFWWEDVVCHNRLLFVAETAIAHDSFTQRAAFRTSIFQLSTLPYDTKLFRRYISCPR